MSKKSVTLTAVVAGVLGITLGAAASGETPEPEVRTETKTVTEEVEVEVPVEVTPQACVDAIAAADEGFIVAGDGFALFGEFADLSSQAVIAASEWDVATLDALTPQIEDVNARLNGLTVELEQSDYRALADECLGGEA